MDGGRRPCAAESSLLENPERPVVLLFNMKTEDPIQTEEWRRAAERMLSRDAPNGWLVVPVTPRLDAWALTDPRIKKDFDTNGAPICMRTERRGSSS